MQGGGVYDSEKDQFRTLFSFWDAINENLRLPREKRTHSAMYNPTTILGQCWKSWVLDASRVASVPLLNHPVSQDQCSI